MSLREDLAIISKKEGFSTTEEFIHNFIVDGNRTFIQLKQWLEQKYRRYYSWIWIYAFCAPMTPQYRVSKRERMVSPSGMSNSEVEELWNNKAIRAGYVDICHAFRVTKSLPDLAALLEVKYITLYYHYQKWKEHK